MSSRTRLRKRLLVCVAIFLAASLTVVLGVAPKRVWYATAYEKHFVLHTGAGEHRKSNVFLKKRFPWLPGAARVKLQFDAAGELIRSVAVR